ncbi:MAG TPA: radical SAM protein, partial [Polyangiales bacterium]|nr:radical SAM protein [Polyangiales bacterium]
MASVATRRKIQERLDAEVGRIEKDAPLRVALTYPSPYNVGMSSLGYQRIYRLIQDTPGICCERVFLADDERDRAEAPVSYESRRALADFPIIAVSVAYELEIAGLIQLLMAAGIPPLAKDRGPRHPFVLAGGPLTFSNPLPLSPFVDAVIMGEAEELVVPVLHIIADSASRDISRAELSQLSGV